jgi:chemotaxis protein MotB
MNAQGTDWARKRRELGEEIDVLRRPGAPRWMVTFGDMMMLLLSFFVLLLSYATMDVHKFQMLLKSIKVGFGQSSSTAVVAPVIPNFGDAEKERSKTDDADIYLAMRLEQLIDERDLSSVVEMTREEAGILIRVRGEVMFDSGSVTLLDESRDFLDAFADLMVSFPHFVLVRGHTDLAPLDPDGPFPSNWELSSARSSSVVRYLTGAGEMRPTRFAVMGHAGTRPLVTGTSSDAFRLNRRVELLLVNQRSRAARDGVTLF